MGLRQIDQEALGKLKELELQVNRAIVKIVDNLVNKIWRREKRFILMRL